MYSVQRSKSFLVGGRHVKTININAPIKFFSDWFLVVLQLYLPGRYRSVPRRSEQRHLSGWLQGQVHFVFDTRLRDSIPNVFKFNSCDDCHLEVCIVCSNIFFKNFLYEETQQIQPCCQAFHSVTFLLSSFHIDSFLAVMGSWHHLQYTLFAPKTLRNLCFLFLLGITVVPREIKEKAYAKCSGQNKVYYGRYANGEWSEGCNAWLVFVIPF